MRRRLAAATAVSVTVTVATRRGISLRACESESGAVTRAVRVPQAIRAPGRPRPAAGSATGVSTRRVRLAESGRPSGTPGTVVLPTDDSEIQKQAVQSRSRGPARGDCNLA